MRSRGTPCSGPTLAPGDPQGAGRKLRQGSSLGRLFQETKGIVFAGEGCSRLGRRNASGLQSLQSQRWGVTQGPVPLAVPLDSCCARISNMAGSPG